MTLLGAFSLGHSNETNAEPSTMDMSLDDMIATRRKQDSKEKNADRSIATGRAKRKAAQDAKRGIARSSKPTQQQIEKEVKKQQTKTAKAKAKKSMEENKKGATAKLPPKLKQEARRSQREINKLVKDAASVTKAGGAIAVCPVHGSAPSKRAVSAAVKAMEKEGYSVPEGMQMVITFAPNKEATQKVVENTFQKPAATKKNAPGGKGNAKKGRGGGGGRGRK